jgi:phosphohistidine phosphatase
VISPSLRTRQTWDQVHSEAGGKAELVVDDRIYANTVAHLLVLIRQTPESVHALALVGHNPSMAELAVDLDDGHGDAAARASMRSAYPTSGVCVFDVGSDWQTVEAATLTHFSAPRAQQGG